MIRTILKTKICLEMKDAWDSCKIRLNWTIIRLESNLVVLIAQVTHLQIVSSRTLFQLLWHRATVGREDWIWVVMVVTTIMLVVLVTSVVPTESVFSTMRRIGFNLTSPHYIFRMLADLVAYLITIALLNYLTNLRVFLTLRMSVNCSFTILLVVMLERVHLPVYKQANKLLHINNKLPFLTKMHLYVATIKCRHAFLMKDTKTIQFLSVLDS